VDKVDNTETQKPWPPDAVLVTMGMTRQEWNVMALSIERKDSSLMEALAQSITQRRMGERTGNLSKAQS